MNKIILFLLGLLLAPAAIFASTPWTGTWAVTPESGGGTFTQQTIRQIVYTSVGGPAARIRLSNLFGSSSVTISDVHIALVSSGSSTQAGTDHLITFSGASTVTIGANAEVYSDSIAMTIPSLSELAISFYLPNSTSVQTYHWIGQQTNYVANGDVSGNTSITVASTTSSYYYLTNLDVQSTALTGAVVTFGASITDGYASSQNANKRWPNDLARRLAAAGFYSVGVINQGLSANQLLIDASGTLSALHRFQHDAVLQPNVQWVIFSDDPLNDVGNNHSITGAQLIAGVQQLISQAHNNGLKFLGSTLTPFHGAGGWSSTGETAREQYNAFILSPSSGCDGVVDQDTATHDPSNPTQFLPAYDSGDHLHPNDAGYQAIANCVNLSFFGTAEAPFGGTPAAIPGTVQAENYDTGGQGVAYNVTSINGTDNGYRSDGVDLEVTSDTGGGLDLGWTSGTQWFNYTVNAAVAGNYTVSFRVAGGQGAVTDAFHLSNASGTNLSGNINVPNTGGWQTWTTVTATVTLPAGQQVLTLKQDNGGWNLNDMNFATSGGGTLLPTQNATVRSGAYANTNFNGATTLRVKNDPPDNTRHVYLTFDTTSMPTVSSAVIKLYVVNTGSTASRTITVYQQPTTSWLESTITWNNAPAAGTLIGTFNVSTTTGIYYNFDVTSYVQAQRAAGHNIVSFELIQNMGDTNGLVDFASREATTGQPGLTIAP
jgi:lysophospholipase L1-like esterase